MSADFLPRVSALDKITEDTELPVPPKTGSPSGLPWLKGKLVKLKGPIAAVAAVGAVLSGMVGYWSTYRTVRGGVEPAVATKALPADAGPLSIVVLPFSNLTGDPAQGYVSDGLTASVTADLSRIRDAFVVGTGTALAFKDKALTAQQVGKDLGVRFVLQGNVQRSGSKVRINAQLTDTASNAQLWSETFDGDSGDLFALQDQVTTLIGNSMGRELVVRAARESERRISSPTVADLLLRARALSIERQSLASLREQEALSRKALALDPANFDAMSLLAHSLAIQPYNFGDSLGSKARNKAIAEAADLCSRMRAVDPEDFRQYESLGTIASMKGDFDGNLRAFEKALALAPKEPGVYINLANALLARPAAASVGVAPASTGTGPKKSE
jgi:adenylate cyclase